MNMFDAILGASNGGAVDQISRQFGLSNDQASSAITALLPALLGGLQREARQPQGLESLLAALAGGQHQRYVEDPVALTDPNTIADGNGILGHIFGSKEVSREVATDAASRTGLSPALLKQILPIVAALAMGVLARQRTGRQAGFAPSQAGQPGSPGADLGGLASMLDFNRDGSVADDVMGFVGKMFGGR
jgi:hypothetical protein